MHLHPSPHHPATRTIALLATALATVAAAVLLSGAPVHAAAPLPGHVHIDGDATAGTSSEISFRVPNESDTAATTSLRVVLPASDPITSVSAEAKPGWDIKIVKSDLNPPVTRGSVQIKSYVSAVVWTATGAGIPVGQYDTFTIRLAVPEAGPFAIPAYQGYGDGTTVAWADPENADGSEPAHPTPTIVVTTGPAPVDEPDLAISVVALILGALGLAAGVIAILVRRRPA